MKLIKYYSNEIVGFNDIENENGNIEQEPIYKLKQLEYKVKDKNYDYWLDVITKTYSEYGEITAEDISNEKTKDEVLTQNIADLLIENSKKDNFISQLAQQINTLNIEINKLKEGATDV